jgi:hypothetical protein
MAQKMAGADRSGACLQFVGRKENRGKSAGHVTGNRRGLVFGMVIMEDKSRKNTIIGRQGCVKEDKWRAQRTRYRDRGRRCGNACSPVRSSDSIGLLVAVLMSIREDARPPARARFPWVAWEDGDGRPSAGRAVICDPRGQWPMTLVLSTVIELTTQRCLPGSPRDEMSLAGYGCGWTAFIGNDVAQAPPP